jgi:hypothetical protein
MIAAPAPETGEVAAMVAYARRGNAQEDRLQTIALQLRGYRLGFGKRHPLKMDFRNIFWKLSKKYL